MARFLFLLSFMFGVPTWGLAFEPTVDIARNVEYVKRADSALAMDVYMPRGDGPFPGVLVVHGGAWMVGSRIQLAAVATALAEHGYTAACVSYRLAPKYTFPAQIYDCQAAVRFLRQHAGDYRLDPERLGGFGYSAGGQLVALLGAMGDDAVREEGVPADAPSARLQAVVAGGAPCDFRLLPEGSGRLAYWLGGTRAAKPDAYREASPAAFITADDPPMFFFHGARDMLVPANSPQRMVAMLTAAGVTAQIHLIENAGHIEALFDRETMRMALEFADRHLKDASSVADRATIANETKDSGEPNGEPTRPNGGTNGVGDEE